MVEWKEKELQTIVDEMWPVTFGTRPDVNSASSQLGVLLRVIDEIIKQRIMEACEEPIDYK